MQAAAGPTPAPLTPPAHAAATLPEVARSFFRHGSPRILSLLALGFAIGRLALLPSHGFDRWDFAITLAIVLLWPLQEWLIHVFVLHWRPRRIGPWLLDFTTPRMHRAHHRDPWRIDLIFIPLQVFLYAPALIVASSLLLAPDLARACTWLAVFFGLALHYEWVHLLVHTRYRPRSRLYLRLWRNHRLHHYKNERYWYGVTMLSGDRLLRTAPRPAETATSATCRTLGLEDELLGPTPG